MQRRRGPSFQMVAVLFALDERADEDRHGYELCRALDLKAGTVYPLLIRLADRGLVDTEWEQDPPQGRPARHLYRLSATGRELVAELRRGAAPAHDVRRASSPRPVLGSAAG
jgi:DNA-binding PadR family transcriptional regulator